jgi:mannose/cellobiose epimerase-like protein (N-acyl-D-glucosamine 2-epimerase family)
LQAYAFAERMGTILADHFLDTPFIGGWTDQITEAGAPKVDYVPASSLYHLFLAATEADNMRGTVSDAKGGIAPAIA